MPYLKLPVVRVSKNQILTGRVKSFRFSAKAVQSGQACLVALYVFSEYGSIQTWHWIPSGFQSLFSLRIIRFHQVFHLYFPSRLLIILKMRIKNPEAVMLCPSVLFRRSYTWGTDSSGNMTEFNCDRAMDRREQPAVRCRWKVTELISIGNFTMMSYEAP